MIARDARLGRIFTSAGLLTLIAFTVLPLVSLFLTALQPDGSAPAGLSLPVNPHWGNFATAWDRANMGSLLVSSLLIAAMVVPVSLVLSTLAGYGLARLPFPGHRLVGGLFVAGLTLPFEAMIAPIYYQIRDLGLLNSRLAIAIPLIGLLMPFSVYWMRSHFLSIPKELGEAASVDGAGPFRSFWSVYVPLSAPAWSSLAILLFLWTWNQFLLALVLVDDPMKRTMAGALGAFQGQYGTDQVLLCAGALLIMAPTLIVFIIFQRSFTRALLQGAER